MTRFDPYEIIQKDLDEALILYKEQKDAKYIEQAFKLIRSVNVYPTPRFDRDGEVAEVLKCIKRDVSGCLVKESNGSWFLKCRFLHGLTLCRCIFPEIAKVRRKQNMKSVYDSFMDDADLCKALKHLFDTRTRCNAPQLHSIMGIVLSNCFNNYNCCRMKALCETFCPPGGLVYDFSSGFGGRMLGCLSSQHHYEYIGVDPNTALQPGYAHLFSLLEEAWKKLAFTGVKAKIHCVGSEDFCPEYLHGKIDFAFSSPPYLSREFYTEEETQCYIKYPLLNDWLQHYVQPTVRNIFTLLKPNGIVGFNIDDYGKVAFVEDWLQIVDTCGFKKVGIIYSQKESRIGTGHDRTALKTDSIYLYRKPI